MANTKKKSIAKKKKNNNKKSVKKSLTFVEILNHPECVDNVSIIYNNGFPIYKITHNGASVSLSKAVFDAVKTAIINKAASDKKSSKKKKKNKNSGGSKVKLNKKNNANQKGKLKTAFSAEVFVPVQLRLKCGNCVESTLAKSVFDAVLISKANQVCAFAITVPGGKTKIKHGILDTTEKVTQNGKKIYYFIEK